MLPAYPASSTFIPNQSLPISTPLPAEKIQQPTQTPIMYEAQGEQEVLLKAYQKPNGVFARIEVGANKPASDPNKRHAPLIGTLKMGGRSWNFSLWENKNSVTGQVYYSAEIGKTWVPRNKNLQGQGTPGISF